MTYVPRLQSQYKDEIAPALVKQFEYSSVMQAPKIVKICLNQGVGKAVGDRKMVDKAVEEMTCYWPEGSKDSFDERCI